MHVPQPVSVSIRGSALPLSTGTHAQRPVNRRRIESHYYPTAQTCCKENNDSQSARCTDSYQGTKAVWPRMAGILVWPTLTCHSIAAQGRVQPAPRSESKVNSTSPQSCIRSRIQTDSSITPEFRLQNISRIRNPTGRYVVDSFLLTSFTTGTTRTGGGSSQSGRYCLQRAAGYFSLSELPNGCRRYGGFRVGRSSEAGRRSRATKRYTGEHMDDSEDVVC